MYKMNSGEVTAITIRNNVKLKYVLTNSIASDRLVSLVTITASGNIVLNVFPYNLRSPRSITNSSVDIVMTVIL